MTIYKDGKESERVTLSDYNDKEKLHELFREKGFEKYTEVELEEMRRLKKEEEEANEEEQQKSLRGNINQLTKPLTGGKLSSKMLRNLKADDKHISRAHQMADIKKKIKEMKKARDDFMMVGLPDDRPKASDP